MEASLGWCWAWSSKPVCAARAARVGSTPTSFRQVLQCALQSSGEPLIYNWVDRIKARTAAAHGRFALCSRLGSPNWSARLSEVVLFDWHRITVHLRFAVGWRFEVSPSDQRFGNSCRSSRMSDACSSHGGLAQHQTRTQQLTEGMASLGHRCLYLNPHLGRESQTVPAQQASIVTFIEPPILKLPPPTARTGVPPSASFDPRKSRPLVRTSNSFLDATGSTSQVAVISFPLWLDVALRLRASRGTPLILCCHDCSRVSKGISADLIRAESELTVGPGIGGLLRRVALT